MSSSKALLVAVKLDTYRENEAEDHIDELERLCRTLDLESCGKLIVPLKEARPKYFIGSGWAEEIAEQARHLEADYIVFDDDLSPSQQRNLEKLCDRPVIDRHQIIIEIFAQRAQTREARLQVELARLIYSLPRLRRMWTHLSRQQGGAKGTRGEGETQLETDRRLVEVRINKLKKDLKKVTSQRHVLRKQRESIPIPSAAIVGYTNAGKSSLHRMLTQSDILVEDKLFATLDPTTRSYKLPSGQKVLLTDTVGFIRKLPHDLVDAFKSTLEETVLAHFLLHLVDASSPDIKQNMATTHLVLKEIGAAEKNELLVFNKCDAISGYQLRLIQSQYPRAIYISAKTGSGIADLAAALERKLQDSLQKVQITLPHSRSDIVAMAHREGQVISTTYEQEGVVLHAYLPDKMLSTLHGKVECVSVKHLHE